MRMPHDSPKNPSSATPLDPKQFPLKGQTAAAANRDKVRQVVPVHAPRQSKAPVERSK
jgi:hypothetical protein